MTRTEAETILDSTICKVLSELGQDDAVDICEALVKLLTDRVAYRVYSPSKAFTLANFPKNKPFKKEINV